MAKDFRARGPRLRHGSRKISWPRSPRQPALQSFSLRFEPLEQRTLLAADFGDAPQFYPTLLAENGAQHASIGPTLGATRDSEANGTHSANADADGADEDGVAFGAFQVGQLGATVTVNVQGGAARLDAWIDFNSDGNWGGPGEQIAENVAVAVGNNAIGFDVPSWAIDGATYARFRLSTAGNLGVGGLAADGEVEDYKVTIIKPTAGRGVFPSHTVSSAISDGAACVFATDLDGDGDMDVLSAAATGSEVNWYENDGGQNFSPHSVATLALGVLSVTAADVDGDGDIDVLSASRDDNKIAWYENDGSQNFSAHSITTAAMGAYSVFAADVDGDGDTDVLSASFDDNKIAWYENDGTPAVGPWTSHTISTAADGADSVFAADVDGDGDIDVLSASFTDDKIAWYENDGTPATGPWTSQSISTAANGANMVIAADVDGDGDIDALSASGVDNKIAWYENDGSQNFSAHTISTAALGPYSIFSADVDGDGDTDVLSASFDDNKIAWYKNDGSQNFAAETITTAALGASSVLAADVDGDGDIDVLSASYGDDKIAWYENLGWDFGDAPQFYPTTSSEIGARHIPTGPTLGATRDEESDGFHSANADADGADEDGMSFGPMQVGQLGATVTVNVQGGAAKLDAWIDFDGDGNWGGPGEQIADNLPVAVGNNGVNFDVPGWAVAGTTFARFRLSTAGDLGVGGLATDGEVEDYPVAIVLPPVTVAARRIFYNNSAFDGNSAAINFTNDNAAIATDKSAYLPNNTTAVFNNITSFSLGINGILVDLTAGGSHAAISASDFIFKVGNNNLPGSWATAPAPASVAVSIGGGVSGSDRVEITWADNAIKNKWLEVQVKANSNTGLVTPDVFFWGNKVGDTGNPSATDFSTAVAGDGGEILTHLGASAGITSIWDINRSNSVTVSGDRGDVVANLGTITRLRIPSGGPFAPEGGGSGVGDAAVGGDTGISSALAGQSEASRSPDTTASAPQYVRPAILEKRPDGTGQIVKAAAIDAAIAGFRSNARDGDDAGRSALEELLKSLAAGS